MKTIFLLLIYAASVSKIFSAEAIKAILPPAATVVAGTQTHVDLVALNPGPQDAPFNPEPEYSSLLLIGDTSWTVILKGSIAFPTFVPPGGYSVRKYTFEVPSEAKGRALLEVKDSDGTVIRALLMVEPSTPGARPIASDKTPLERLASAASATSALSRGFAGRFMPNLPVYFIYGGGAAQGAKFQLSFDYRLATLVTGGADDESVTTLRLGYTQRTLWDINGSSSPFYDTSYMPELVLNLDSPMPSDPNQRFTWLGLRGGFQHESNGKAGNDSRSLNTFYFRPRFVLGKLREWDLVLLPEVQAYIGGLGDNNDLKNYRGYGKLRFYLGRSDGPSLMFTGWSGQHFDHGSYQFDLAIPARVRWLNIEAFYYLQYFNGYGESLLAYRAKSDALRVGVGLLR